jgi:putative pyruvate formate lyase activating enzyme
VPKAIDMGLRVPLVYNTGAYDRVETLRLLDGVFDIYMPDFKFWSADLSGKYFQAPDYPQVARAALREMHRQVGDLVVDRNGIALRGLLVRHLVMPGCVEDTREIMRFLAREISPNTYVNVMAQYRPCGDAYAFSELSRGLEHGEYAAAVAVAREAGLTRLDKRRPKILFEWM